MSQLSYLKTSNYKLLLGSQHKNLEFYCTSVTLPAITIGGIDIPFQSMKRKIPGDSIEFDNLTCNIILDEDLQVLDDILSTIQMTHDPETNIYSINPILFTGQLFITTNKNNPSFLVTFHDMWLETFSELQFMSTSTDENNLNTTCGFRFNYYTWEKI